MIITAYGIIVFHLVEWIAIVKKSFREEMKDWSWAVGFPLSAVPTRHEVHGKPYLQGT